MNTITNPLAQAAGTRTSATWYPQMLETTKGMLQVGYYLITDATITFTIEGRMETTDAWVSMVTVDQTDFGSTLLTAFAGMKAFDLLPQMRISVTSLNAASISTAWVMEY